MHVNYRRGETRQSQRTPTGLYSGGSGYRAIKRGANRLFRAAGKRALLRDLTGREALYPRWRRDILWNYL